MPELLRLAQNAEARTDAQRLAKTATICVIELSQLRQKADRDEQAVDTATDTLTEAKRAKRRADAAPREIRKKIDAAGLAGAAVRAAAAGAEQARQAADQAMAAAAAAAREAAARPDVHDDDPAGIQHLLQALVESQRALPERIADAVARRFDLPPALEAGAARALPGQ